MQPQKYVGLTREELQQELELYEKSPSLTDQEEGLSGVELLPFPETESLYGRIMKKLKKDIILFVKTTRWLCTTEV